MASIGSQNITDRISVDMNKDDIDVLLRSCDFSVIREGITEDLSPENYLCVVLNVLWLVENHLGKFVDMSFKIEMSVRTLQSIDDYAECDHSMTIEQIYKISSDYKRLIKFEHIWRGGRRSCCTIYGRKLGTCDCECCTTVVHYIVYTTIVATIAMYATMVLTSYWSIKWH